MTALMTAPYRTILPDCRLLAIHDEPSAHNNGPAKVMQATRSDVRFQGVRSRLSIPRALRANPWEGCSCARQETGPLDVG